MLKWQNKYAEIDKHLKDSRVLEIERDALAGQVEQLEYKATQGALVLKENDDLRSKIGQLTAQNEALCAELRACRQNLEEAEREGEIARKSWAAAEAALRDHNLKNTEANYKRTMETMEASIRQLMSEQASSDVSMRELQEQVSALKCQLRAKDDDIKKALLAADEQRHTVDVLRRQMHSWASVSDKEQQARIRELQAALDTALSDAQELSHYKDECARLRSQVEQERLVILDLKNHLGLGTHAQVESRVTPRSVNPLESLLATMTRPSSSRGATPRSAGGGGVGGGGGREECLRDEVALLHEQVMALQLQLAEKETQHTALLDHTDALESLITRERAASKSSLLHPTSTARLRLLP